MMLDNACDSFSCLPTFLRAILPLHGNLLLNNFYSVVH